METPLLFEEGTTGWWGDRAVAAVETPRLRARAPRWASARPARAARCRGTPWRAPTSCPIRYGRHPLCRSGGRCARRPEGRFRRTGNRAIICRRIAPLEYSGYEDNAPICDYTANACCAGHSPTPDLRMRYMGGRPRPGERFTIASDTSRREHSARAFLPLLLISRRLRIAFGHDGPGTATD